MGVTWPSKMGCLYFEVVVIGAAASAAPAAIAVDIAAEMAESCPKRSHKHGHEHDRKHGRRFARVVALTGLPPCLQTRRQARPQT